MKPRALKNRSLQLSILITVIITMTLSLASCGNGTGVKEDPDAPDRGNKPKVLATKASGEKTFSGNNCKVDYSNTKNGYIMAQYTGSNKKVKLQLNVSGGEVYNYDLNTNGKYQAFPLSEGNGTYTIGIFENVSGEEYSQALKNSFEVKLKNEFQPYLRPSQYVDYNKKSDAVKKGGEVCEGVKSDLGAVAAIYDYVIENVDYDTEKAATVQPGYLPDIDSTLESGMGICFDYASLTTAMLRSQKIPTKLIVGYAGQAYHAWISVYTEEEGWIENIVEFHSNEWTIMDPTFNAAGGDNASLVGDGKSYNPIYYY